MDLAEYEKLNPHSVVNHVGRAIRFATPNTLSLWRVDSLFTKEPDTIAWIASFRPGEVLLDVGANVGMYSIWAAATAGARVFAFEPEAQNYALLNQNIMLNALDGLVRGYCAAITDRAGFDALYLSAFSAAGSCHSLGAPMDHHNAPRAAPFTQGCYATTIDALVDSGTMPVPTHIKIDVDGLEHKVIAGASSTLQDRQVRSVLVEINTHLDDHWAVVDKLVDLGFSYSQEQVTQAQRTEGTFEGVGNYVFRR